MQQYLFAVSVSSSVLCSKVHIVDQTVGIRSAQYWRRYLVICGWTQLEINFLLLNWSISESILQTDFWWEKTDILLLLHNNVYCHVFNPSPSIKLGESLWSQRSLRPSGDQHGPADGGRSACTGRLLTPPPLRSWVGRGRGLFHGWLTAAARLRVPISDTLLPHQSPLLAAKTPLLWYLHLCPAPCRGQQHLWHSIMFGQNTYTNYSAFHSNNMSVFLN